MESEQLPGPWKGRDMHQTPDGIIVHSMGEYIAGQFAPDFIKSIGLSVHAFIGVDGKVYFGAATNRVAYHAGVSSFQGQNNLNNTFLGFEILVEGDHNMATFTNAIQNGDPYSDAQYQAAGELCSQWINEFGISKDRILGHSDVSGPDVRPTDPKIDPGNGFNWDKFRSFITA